VDGLDEFCDETDGGDDVACTPPEGRHPETVRGDEGHTSLHLGRQLAHSRDVFELSWSDPR
jgi:hypothetical protein